MDMNAFIDRVLDAAKKAGLEQAEVYYNEGNSFSASSVKGEIADYSVHSTGGLSLRGLWKGKMGYASTEAFDDEAISQLISGVQESAELIEDESVQEIFAGSPHYETVENYNAALDKVDEKDKLALVLQLENEALHMDERISQVGHAMVETGSGLTILKNTYGLSLSHRDNSALAYVDAVARKENHVSNEDKFKVTRDFSSLDAKEIAKAAVENTLFMLDAVPVKSGTYRALFEPTAVVSFLATFCGVFSAENAQQGLSLLLNKEGETIAAPCVTLCDDPLLDGGFSSRPFDAEGVATYKKNIIENGVLKTLLHNLKTARKAGVQTTGNASRSSYSSSMRVGPFNLYFVPGMQTKEQLMESMGDGLVITDVSGLHAGANAISGDFSLIAKGYTVKNGKKDAAVEQITVAGNFYQLLKNIRAVGSDLTFPSGGIGSPTLDVGEISVAGV